MEIDFSVMATLSDLDCLERLSGLLITFSPCLGYFFSFESVFWCAVCRSKPAMMWVATSSIGFALMASSVRIPLPSSMVLTSILCGVMLLTGIRMRPSSLSLSFRLPSSWLLILDTRCSGGDQLSCGFLQLKLVLEWPVLVVPYRNCCWSFAITPII
ncbi:hypothetical protein F2Q69_00062056 [Brassica cretica]|uniref:Uncharacterized protein n=1 Tax=Brassica cretica TaxID=69181 RepID=A0A8S9RDY1_BRACR|nr:hypothetical protein F2Q69_00062056 [Brassica cretica]